MSILGQIMAMGFAQSVRTNIVVIVVISILIIIMIAMISQYVTIRNVVIVFKLCLIIMMR